MELVRREVKVGLRKLNVDVTIEHIQDLRSCYGMDYDIEKHFEELLRKERIKERRRKIEKITNKTNENRRKN